MSLKKSHNNKNSFVGLVLQLVAAPPVLGFSGFLGFRSVEMAPKENKPRTVSRNPDLIRGIGKFSKSRMYHKRGIWAIKAKNGGAFPKHAAAATPEKPAEKAPKFYPADDVKKPIANRRKPKPTKLRSLFSFDLDISCFCFSFDSMFMMFCFFSGQALLRAQC